MILRTLFVDHAIEKEGAAMVEQAVVLQALFIISCFFGSDTIYIKSANKAFKKKPTTNMVEGDVLNISNNGLVTAGYLPVFIKELIECEQANDFNIEIEEIKRKHSNESIPWDCFLMDIMTCVSLKLTIEDGDPVTIRNWLDTYINTNVNETVIKLK